MTGTPIMFLDVDGVINAFPPPRDPQYVQTQLLGYRIAYRPALVERLNHLSDRVEIVWLTTWEADARTVLAPAIGLSEFEVIGDRTERVDRPYPFDWWKLAAVDRALAMTDRPFVWCDDDLDVAIRADVKARYGDDRCRLITPIPSIGITDHNLDRIESFVAEHRGRTA